MDVRKVSIGVNAALVGCSQDTGHVLRLPHAVCVSPTLFLLCTTKLKIKICCSPMGNADADADADADLLAR